jgi:hypothetical protein
MIILFNTGCPKSFVEANYSFAVNSQLSPDLDSAHVGDSIFLNSTFAVKLEDQITGAIVDYSNVTDIGSTLGVVNLNDGIYSPADAVDNFDYAGIIGEVFNDKSVPSPNKFQH